MSDYAGVTPIPDYLNISDWYELVEGDSIPEGWLVLMVFKSGAVQTIEDCKGYSAPGVSQLLLKKGHRVFTRTPPPSAIKRIRKQETQQEELPAQLPPDLQELRDKLVGHTDPVAMSRRISRQETQLKQLEDKLDRHIDTFNNYIDGA